MPNCNALAVVGRRRYAIARRIRPIALALIAMALPACAKTIVEPPRSPATAMYEDDTSIATLVATIPGTTPEDWLGLCGKMRAHDDAIHHDVGSPAACWRLETGNTCSLQSLIFPITNDGCPRRATHQEARIQPCTFDGQRQLTPEELPYECILTPSQNAPIADCLSAITDGEHSPGFHACMRRAEQLPNTVRFACPNNGAEVEIELDPAEARDVYLEGRCRLLSRLEDDAENGVMFAQISLCDEARVYFLDVDGRGGGEPDPSSWLRAGFSFVTPRYREAQMCELEECSPDSATRVREQNRLRICLHMARQSCTAGPDGSMRDELCAWNTCLPGTE